MPPASTATVKPSVASAARCAAPSMPYAPPDTTDTSRSTRPAANSAATCSPYVGARSGSDDCGGPFGHVVEANRADNPQGQRRMSLRPQLTVHTCERRERQQRPLVIVGRDQAAAMAIKHVEIFCRAIDPATGFSAAGKVVGDVACLDPIRRLDRPDTTDQGRQFRTRRLGHPGQVRQRESSFVTHCTPSGCRKLRAVLTSSTPGAVRPCQVSERPRDTQCAIHSADAEHSAVEGRSQRSHHVGVQPEPAPQQNTADLGVGADAVLAPSFRRRVARGLHPVAHRRGRLPRFGGEGPRLLPVHEHP